MRLLVAGACAGRDFELAGKEKRKAICLGVIKSQLLPLPYTTATAYASAAESLKLTRGARTHNTYGSSTSYHITPTFFFSRCFFLAFFFYYVAYTFWPIDTASIILFFLFCCFLFNDSLLLLEVFLRWNISAAVGSLRARFPQHILSSRPLFVGFSD